MSISASFDRLSQPKGFSGLRRGHPLVKGLVLAVTSASGLWAFDYAQNAIITSFGTPPVIKETPYGRAISSNGGGLIATLNDGSLGTAAYTNVFYGNVAGIDGFYGGLYAFCSNDGLSQNSGLQRNASSNDLIDFHTPSSAGATFTGEVSNTIGTPQMLVTTCDGSVTVNMYRNGLLVGSANDNATPSVISNSRLVMFGERSANASFGADGDIYLILRYNRILTASEISWLYKKPWQIFNSYPGQPLYLPNTAAAAGGFFARYYYDMIGVH